MELDYLPIFEKYFTYRRVISPASIAKNSNPEFGTTFNTEFAPVDRHYNGTGLPPYFRKIFYL